MTPDENAPDFDVAVSFAGEDRSYVVDVVNAVKDELTVFYDEDYLLETWGEDLVDYFTNLYQRRSRFVVMFISHHYRDKMWTNIERRSALARAITQRSAYILPVRLDDTQLDGLLPTVGYVDARRVGIDKLIDLIRQKAAPEPRTARPIEPLPTEAPSTPEDFTAIAVQRPRAWEYLLFAGLLRHNMEELEAKYRDFSIGYSGRGGRSVSRADMVDYTQSAINNLGVIVANFNALFQPEVQVAAFGAQGEPGDVDRIGHLARRIIAVYEDFMDWASEVRSTSADLGSMDALRKLAHFADQPVEELREFVRVYSGRLRSALTRADSGESVTIGMEITLTLDDALVTEFNELLRVAVLRN